ncbi:hypothetical protein A0H81_04479 [Grifola frondosa]|uniref:Wax synthase domain-containing protein n=1 Tax=Grifola frondosa TaxID=5627 RepID=A0A1C7MFJ4_GRIFR|nr:hypothetical protein A0H81_04479 [Grifola frondosa]
MSGIEMYYDIVTLVAVILLNQPPALWPPIQDNPWKTRSLHELWAKRWHQGLRHTFLTLGGYPGQWLMGDLGMVIGAFLASGLFHEAGLYILGRGMDHRVTLFFLLQAFGIIVEKLFSKLTGRKAGGVIGTSWAILNVVGFGQMCTDAWFARGIGGGVVVPPNLSPIRMILLPAIRIAVM